MTEAGKKRYGIGSGRGRKLARDLNTLDADRVTNQYRENRAKKTGNKEKYKKYKEARIETEKAIQNLLAAAKKQHINIDSKEVKRYARLGEMQIGLLLGGYLGGAVTELAAWAITGDNAMYKGKKYRAK